MHRQLYRISSRYRAKSFLLILLATITIALSIITRPILHLALAAWSERDEIVPLPLGMIDDASRLNQTPMEIVRVPSNQATAKVLLRNVLKDAKVRGLQVTISGSRHTMGGQTIYPNGISLDMTQFNQMQLNPATGNLTVQSGATWSEILPYLNQQG